MPKLVIHRNTQRRDMNRTWDVTAYTDRDGNVWRLRANGTWIGPAGVTHATTADVAAVHGPLTPTAVSSLAALVKDAERLRVTGEYWVGGEACFDGECDHDDRGDGVCVDMEVRFATRADAITCERIDRIVGALFEPTDEDHGDALEAIRQVLAERSGGTPT